MDYRAGVDALEERFGSAFTRLEESLRENGWADERGMAATPEWVKALSG